MIDAYSSEVYGHVVASDVFGKVYVVPMEDILQDIKERLKASSVRLAPASHVLAKRRSHLETQQPPTSRPQLAQSNAYSHPNAPHISGTADENELPDAKLRTHYAMMRSETTTPKPPQYPKPESQLPDSGYSTMHNTPSNSPPPASTSLPIAGWKPAFLRTGTDPSPKTVEDKSIHGEDDPNWATLVAGAIAGTLPLVAAAVVSARAEHEKSTGTSTIDDSAQTETNMTAAEEPSKDHKFRTIWKILRKNIKIQKE